MEEQCHPTKLFIGGLSRETTTQQLREHFSGFGAVTDAVVLRWPDGRSRGFGYVTYSCPSAASAALSHRHSLGGRAVDVKRAVPGTNKLFVGGLPQSTTAEELRAYFETLGPISDAVVMIDPTTGRSRGFGFVCFRPGQEGATAVSEALARYDSHRLRGKWVEVKSAAPPRELAAQEASLAPSPAPPPQRTTVAGQVASWAAAAAAAQKAAEVLAAQAVLPQANGRPPATPFPKVDDAPTLDGHFGEPLKVSLPTDGFGMLAPPPGLLQWGTAGFANMGGLWPGGMPTRLETPVAEAVATWDQEDAGAPDLSGCLGVAAELGALLGEEEGVAMEGAAAESLRSGLRELLLRCLPPERGAMGPPATAWVGESHHVPGAVTYTAV